MRKLLTLLLVSALLFTIIGCGTTIPKDVTPEHGTTAVMVETVSQADTEEPTVSMTELTTEPSVEESTSQSEVETTETTLQNTISESTEPETEPTEESEPTKGTEPGKETESTEETEPEEYADYVLNKNTKKFHYPYCSSVAKIKEKNKELFHGSREEIISRGYDPCGRCHP